MALSALTQAALHTHRKQRRLRGAESAFGAFVAAPHDFGNVAAAGTSANALAVPAGVELAVALDTAWDEGDITLELADGRSITARAGLADQIVKVTGLIHRGLEVEIGRGAGGPAGALSVYLVARERRILIATATFTA